jgi:guanylate kinase
MTYVITLTGASQCGKSKVIEILHRIGEERSRTDFIPVTFQKYTTRAFRENEIAAIKNGRASSLDQRPVIGEYNNDDSKDEEALAGAKMRAFQSKECDLAYEQFGDRYGLRLADLYEHLKVGRTPIVILNDVRTVEDIKTKLGGQCFSVFIFREVPNMEHFAEEGKKRGESIEATKIRFQKATAIYRIYIENIYIFDKLILNVDKGTESLEKILNQLIDHLCSPMAVFK